MSRVKVRGLIVKGTLKSLRRFKNSWKEPISRKTFSSRRLARVWIKKNLGAVFMDVSMRLPGAIRTVEIKGTFEL